MFKIVDGRLHSGVLTAHGSKGFTLFGSRSALLRRPFLGKTLSTSTSQGGRGSRGCGSRDHSQRSRIFSFVSSFVFVSVPMFVLMAAILDRSGIARDLFDAMKIVGGRLKGRSIWSICRTACMEKFLILLIFGEELPLLPIPEGVLQRGR